MNMTATVDEMDGFSFHETILQQGELISDKLNMLRIEHFPPDAMKSLRTFSLAEVAYFLGVTQSNIKKLHLDGKGPIPTTLVSGRRTYTAEQMLELRQYLDRHGRADFKKYVPHRRAGEQLAGYRCCQLQGRQRKDDNGRASGTASCPYWAPGPCDRPRSTGFAFRSSRHSAGTR